MKIHKSMICCDDVESRRNVFNECNKTLKNKLHKFKAIITKENYKHYCRVSVEENISTRHYNTFFQTMPNKLGCNLSHGRLLKFLNKEKSDFDWFLILEDDVVIDKDINNLLPEIISQAKSVSSEYVRLEYMDKTYVCLGKKYSPRIQIHDSRKMSEGLYKALPQYGSRGQLISKAGIRLILDDLPFDDHVDNFFCKRRKKLNASVYKDSIVQTIGSEDYGDSSAKISSLINNNLCEKKFTATELHNHNE